MNDANHLPPIPAVSAQAAYVSGLTALREGDAAAAIPLLEVAFYHDPSHQGRRRNLIRALLAAERHACVVLHASTGLSDTPNDPELHFALGTALSALGEPRQARAAFSAALNLRRAHAPTWLNLANACIDLDDTQAAETFCRNAIGLDPGLSEAHASLGYLLTRQGRLPEAIAACESAVRLRPDFAQAHWNRAVALLLSGDLPRGFAAYEWRKRHASFQRDFAPLRGPVWDGADLAGKTILVRAEQGAGDTIQFARYLMLLRDVGAAPIVVCAAALAPLLRRMPGIETTPTPAAGHDVWVDQASLPLLFGTTLDTIPCPDAYLVADPAQVQRWRWRLPSGRRVGLVFAGNPRHTGDRWRSIPPGLLAPLLATPNVSFVNLMCGAGAGAVELPNLSAAMTDYAETAAMIEALDLVVSVDTSVAHLAGALGKPTWLLLPHAPDWRWMLHRHDSPWYRSMRLFRQPAPGDWTTVLTTVADALRNQETDVKPETP